MKKLVLSIVLGITVAVASAQERPTHELHAAMLYNFIKYIQWPNESEPGDFVVGVIGDENVFNTLKTWYDGKAKGTKKYVIKKLSSAGEAESCQVVYVGKSKNKEFDNIKTSVPLESQFLPLRMATEWDKKEAASILK